MDRWQYNDSNNNNNNIIIEIQISPFTTLVRGLYILLPLRELHSSAIVIYIDNWRVNGSAPATYIIILVAAIYTALYDDKTTANQVRHASTRKHVDTSADYVSRSK